MKHGRISTSCLIADDVRASRELLQSWMVNDGFACAMAKDGAEAWEIIEDSPPDFVVTDIEMPRLSGLGLLKKIRASDGPEIRRIPILVMTSLHDCQTLELVQQLGGNGLLVKPLDKKTVDSVLLNLLAGKLGDEGFAVDSRANQDEGNGVISPALRRLFQNVLR